MAFDGYGRRKGVSLLLKGSRTGAGLLLRPVDSVRYFEFPFTLSCLPEIPARCLDVSSPRLFSLYVAESNPAAAIRMINPDGQDAAATATLVHKLRLENVEVSTCSVDALRSERGEYTCIWSISVVEHIAGAYDDREAVRWMYDALMTGGRLILTLPVDRSFWEEYRHIDHYGTQPDVGARYFFQRWYDKNAIWERIVGAIGREPDTVQWFGEIEPGHFADYERRWMQKGFFATVDDPREIVDHWSTFPSWESMPGQGVCGLMFEKRKESEGIA